MARLAVPFGWPDQAAFVVEVVVTRGKLRPNRHGVFPVDRTRTLRSNAPATTGQENQRQP